MGFIKSTGRGFNRRISLGILFSTTANMAVEPDENLNNPAKSEITTAKSDMHNRQYGGDYNPYTNRSSKEENFYLLKNEYHHDMKQLHRLGLENKIIDFDSWQDEEYGN